MIPFDAMNQWKLPPKAKIYEALSAALDGRVKIIREGSAEVTSSGGDKVYKVKWTPDSRQITSTDPATRFQGYIGYPIVALLLHTGRLTFDAALAQPLAGVPWKQLNDKFKRDYDAAVESVLRSRTEDSAALRDEVDRIYADLEALHLTRPE
jgi:hypothetical protein